MGRRRLRRVASSACCPVPRGPAHDCRPPGAFPRQTMVVACGARRDRDLPAHLRISAGLGRHVDGPGLAHGILFSPRHHHRPARQCRGRSPHATPHARGHPGDFRGVYLPPARETSRSAHRFRTPSHHRNRARIGKPAPRRSSRSHSISRIDRRSFCCVDPGDDSCAPSRATRSHRTGCAVGSILSSRHPVSNAPRPHFAD